MHGIDAPTRSQLDDEGHLQLIPALSKEREIASFQTHFVSHVFPAAGHRRLLVVAGWSFTSTYLDPKWMCLPFACSTVDLNPTAASLSRSSWNQEQNTGIPEQTTGYGEEQT